MRYVSTRGRSPSVGFVDAVLAGLAPDGGLYIPETWPTFTHDEIAAFAGKPYAHVAAAVLSAFAGDEIAPADMLAMCEEAYATFRHPAVVPLVQTGPETFIAELFHGPSLAFKDVAMQILARLYDHILTRQGRTQTILCATSGDTGGAAVEAFRGRSSVRVMALFPEGRISEVQRRFMTAAVEANVACIAVAGDFDDCQAIVKDAFRDDDLRQAVDLSGVNSINFARIAAQAVYYFTSAVALGAPHRPVSFCVPSGNFGDAFAGFVARTMGLPIARIVVATNSNDILARAFTTGRYARGSGLATISPAMDIQSASNFERLFFEATGRDAAATEAAFNNFAQSGGLDVPAPALSAMQAIFQGLSTGEDETRAAIAETLAATGELIDPHTAVAVAALAHADAPGPIIVLSTAHPAKFPEDVEAASGREPTLPAGVAQLADRPERFDRAPADPAVIKARLRAFAGA
jgi:threonine synthase